MQTTTSWHPVLSFDIDTINRIGDLVHADLPERREVFAEKTALFPGGCRKLVDGARIVGYGIAHPWILFSIPPLDTFLGSLPQNPQCLYIHDVVVLPEARGGRAAARYVDYIKNLAMAMNIGSLALVSVYGTDVLWSRFGFQVVHNPELNGKLASYGTTAKYMVYGRHD